jgi:hypothetical protein
MRKQEEAHDPLCSEGTRAGDQTMPCDCRRAPQQKKAYVAEADRKHCVDSPTDEHGYECVLCGARLIADKAALLAALHLAAEALDAYSDVNDGEDGFPRPNRAMSALQEIDEVILKAEGKPR